MPAEFFVRRYIYGVSVQSDHLEEPLGGAEPRVHLNFVGHMNTTLFQLAGTRRRWHSDEFKADLVAACTQPGISIAAVAVAMANGFNANLRRCWVTEVEMKASVDDDSVEAAVTATKSTTNKSTTAPSFIPVSLPSPATPTPPPDIRIELQRGATAVTVTWPASARPGCAS